MIERRVIDRNVLINKLNSMRYEYIDELQMNCLFVTLGRTIQIKEVGDVDAVQTNGEQPE